MEMARVMRKHSRVHGLMTRVRKHSRVHGLLSPITRVLERN